MKATKIINYIELLTLTEFGEEQKKLIAEFIKNELKKGGEL